MEEDDLVQVDPVNLTLDELIAVNAVKNAALKNAEKAPEAFVEDKPLDDLRETIKKRDSYKESVNNRLRRIPNFGSLQIHSRLGYIKSNIQGRRPFKPVNRRYNNYAQAFIRSKVNNARLCSLRRFQRQAGLVELTVNDPIVSPLTTQTVNFHNRLNGTPVNGSSPPSVFSLRTRNTMSAQPKRHRIKDHLKPWLQTEIKNIAQNTPEAKRNRDVANFRATPVMTNLLIGQRFSAYE